MSASQRRGSLSGEVPAGGMLSQRRASVPQGTGNPLPGQGLLRRGSKLTFLGAGRRVSMLVKYRQAVQGGRTKAKDVQVKEDNPMEPIRELPHSPRFSTFLSPEAQYAMMKGYEDKLYDKIADSNPDARTSLKRSKTPFQKISIVDTDDNNSNINDNTTQEGFREEDEEEEREADDVKSSTTTSTLTTATSSNGRRALADVTKSVDNTNRRSFRAPEATPSPTLTIPTSTSPFLRPLRRQSVAVAGPFGADLNGNKMTSPRATVTSHLDNGNINGPPGGENGLQLHRSYSLPSLDPPGGLSMKKRLVLTYRLESAMDLLDTLKIDKKKEQEVAAGAGGVGSTSSSRVKVGEGEGQGEGPGEGEGEGQSLSPRVLRGQSVCQKGGDPVKDFNCWTRVWNKEFKEVSTK